MVILKPFQVTVVFDEKNLLECFASDLNLEKSPI